jgi:hypothetical protein
MMRTLAAGMVAIAAITAAPTAHADAPLPGQQCMDWHATASDGNGGVLTCTHLADSGHIMYWEYGGAQDTAWVVTR